MRDFDAIKKKEMSSIENRIRHIYNVGYEDCLKDQQKAKDEAYKQGLHDAWECVKRFLNTDGNTCDKIFGFFTWNDFTQLSPSEAIEKFKEYDEKHFDVPESMRGEIKVGDIVETGGFSKPVIVINTPFDFEDSDEIKVMNYLGDTAWVKIKNCSMTGRHIDKLAETFEQLKNE